MRLRAARIERDELRHRPHRPRVRRPAVLALVFFDQLPDPRADSAPPRGELVPHRLEMPAISHPFPSARATVCTPSRAVRYSARVRSAIAPAAGFAAYSAVPSRVRQARRSPGLDASGSSRSTRLRIALCTCSCGSWSRLVCCANDAITHSCASTNRPEPLPW